MEEEGDGGGCVRTFQLFLFRDTSTLYHIGGKPSVEISLKSSPNTH